MDISVLGVDLGKNVCGVVGLDASGASQGKAGDADCYGGEASSVRCRDGGLFAGLIISAACSPPVATMSG